MSSSGTIARVGRRGRVLVIDDEPYVAHALALCLSEENDVTTLLDAATALASIDAGARFDVILCDLMMPGISGIEFHAALTASHPDLVGRIVFITGGAVTGRAREFLARVSNGCIDKPPDPASLRAIVRQAVARVLDADAANGERSA